MITIGTSKKRAFSSRLTVSPEKHARLISTVCNSGKAASIARSIGYALRENGMSKMSARIGASRSSLYRSFGKTGNPTLQILLDVLKALGLKILIVPIDTPTNKLFDENGDALKATELNSKLP